MNTRTFTSEYSVYDGFKDFEESIIQEEPMFFRSTLEYAWEKGGPITRKFVENLPRGWHNKDIWFDSRSHMLQPGWFPCIPGWHHDAVQRTRADGQPNYDAPFISHQILGLCNGEIAPTQFAIGAEDFIEPPVGELIYKAWNNDVDRLIHEGKLSVVNAPSGRYVGFDGNSWHRGTACVKPGWRWFGRVTRLISKDTFELVSFDKVPDYIGKPYNKIRNQVQVYLSPLTIGW